MVHLIDKVALVAEIEKIRKTLNLNLRHDQGVCDGLYAIQKYINTLEMKEAYLEKEIESYFKGFGKFPSVGIDDCIDIAKHFFELGLQARQQ